MKIRQEKPYLADIYPAGAKICGICGTTNLLGESFYTRFKLFGDDELLCPECNKIEEDIKKERQRQRYVDGDEEPTFTDEIVCPWCGYEELDSWEAPDQDDEAECEECKKIFAYERDIEVTYSSRRVEVEKNE